jgi:energy-converting hydrogenase Eha subunit A
MPLDPITATGIAAVSIAFAYILGKHHGKNLGFDAGVKATLMKCLIEGYIDNPEEILRSGLKSMREENDEK